MKRTPRLFLMPWMIVLFGALFLVGCNAPAQRAHTPVTSPAAPTVASDSPVLDRTSGKEVLYLSSEAFANGAKNADGTFVSSGPYQIGAICTGTGKLTIQTTSLSFSIDCTRSGNMQIEQFGSTDTPPPSQTNRVQVIASGTSVWEVSVQLVSA